MTSLDDLFDRYRSRTYNCWDHTNEVWYRLRGIKLKVGTVLALSAARDLRRIPKPTSPCIVLMEHPLLEKHVGVFFDGQIIHLAARGVEYMPVDVVTRSYATVRYYQ